MICKKHPKYKAMREPTSGCQVCLDIFNAKKTKELEELKTKLNLDCAYCKEGMPISAIEGMTVHFNPYNSITEYWPCETKYDINSCKHCARRESLAFDFRKVLLHRSVTMDFECDLIK